MEQQTDIIPVGDQSLILAGYEDKIKELKLASRAENTMRAYKSDIGQFKKFCELHGQPFALPHQAVEPFVVASFIGWQDKKGLKATTIARRISALSAVHVKGNMPDPTKTVLVSETMEGLRRTRAAGGEKAKRARPVDPVTLRQMAGTIGTSLGDKRDWAIALIGFAGLLRRSEIAALNCEDIERRPDGLVLHIRMSKTDQTGEGDVVGIPMATEKSICPVGALESYLAAAGHSEGPLFQNHGARAKRPRIEGRVVAYVIKKLAKSVHLDPVGFSGHSLRAGGATAMAENGVDLGMIVSHGRWQSPQTVSKHYVRPANALGESNPMRKIL